MCHVSFKTVLENCTRKKKLAKTPPSGYKLTITKETVDDQIIKSVGKMRTLSIDSHSHTRQSTFQHKKSRLRLSFQGDSSVDIQNNDHEDTWQYVATPISDDCSNYENECELLNESDHQYSKPAFTLAGRNIH